MAIKKMLATLDDHFTLFLEPGKFRGSAGTPHFVPSFNYVNTGTASSSEILPGALKDNRRAVLYGKPTFGKGKIQSSSAI